MLRVMPYSFLSSAIQVSVYIVLRVMPFRFLSKYISGVCPHSAACIAQIQVSVSMQKTELCSCKLRAGMLQAPAEAKRKAAHLAEHFDESGTMSVAMALSGQAASNAAALQTAPQHLRTTQVNLSGLENNGL